MRLQTAQSCKITEAARSESKCPNEGPRLSAARAPHSSSLTPDEVRFFLHTTFLFLFPLKQFKYTVFCKMRIFFFIIQTCFSNLDTLQSTSNEAPSLELDPCIYYNMNPLSQSSSPQCTGVHELINVRIYRAVPSSIHQIREAGSGF